ncbi:histidine phosphatase superfamily [Bombardia bombarda]|uniref:Histidine phosphatase superfamily n=1 Tax=Bombardia bombarda TaxID=252184 RepID=A0AA39XIH8_9PEZI|nr:histidine phosphatase superfamily [Bombardia bombarda]
MALLSAAVLGLALAAAPTEAVQSTSEHIWSSSVWLLHGETTPIHGRNPSLTPIGAQQMLSQGALFRDRYLDWTENLGVDYDDDDVSAPIVGIGRIAIENSQLDIASSTDSFTFGSALAFLQGLYPPRTQAFAESAGGMEAATLANGTMLNYPLDGYQYPNIKSASLLDQESIWIQGHVGCSQYERSKILSRFDAMAVKAADTNTNFYAELYNQTFHKDFDPDETNFDHAYELYDYAAYEYHHGKSNITSGQLVSLADLAAREQTNKNANLTAYGNTPGDNIRAIAGRSMATKVLNSFDDNISQAGVTSKLSLQFTTQEPFISFFTLSDAIGGPSGDNFLALPNPGAAMVFELYSIGGNDSVYPADEDLWVRFLYRNGTDPAAKLTQYPLFGNGNEMSRITWAEFKASMERFDIDSVPGWCGVCNSVAPFCLEFSESSGGSGDTSSSGSSDGGNAAGAAAQAAAMSPAVAGVIGAAASISLIGLALLGAILMGGIRFHRNADPKQRSSTLGGFRGAEKMASDTDIAYAKSGARHERTGSWELRGGGRAVTVTAAAAGATIQSKRSVRSLRDIDDDDISEMGVAPVKPREF